MEPRDLNFSESERSILDALLADSSARARRRARVVLDWAQGNDARAIARELNTRQAHVHRVVAQFQEKRLDCFSAAARKRAANSHNANSARDPSPLSAHSSMYDAAHAVLTRQFSKLTHVEAGVRAGDDVEAVHDMRVAFRRINSAFRLFKQVLPNKHIRNLRALLQELRDTLGQARNLDVLRADLETYTASVSATERAQLQPLAETWRAERAEQQRALLALLDRTAYGEWREGMNTLLQGQRSAARIADVLPALLWKQYGAVRAYETYFERASVQELHALRIEIKRLRYTLEFFAEAFSDVPTDLVQPLIALQDHLGAMQDAVVAGRAVTTFIAAKATHAAESGEPLADFQALAAYHAHLNTRIEELRAALPEKFRVILAPNYRGLLAKIVAEL